MWTSLSRDISKAGEAETEGASLFEPGNGQWNIDELKKLLNKVVNDGKVFEDYRVEHRFPEIGDKRMLLNARLLHEAQQEESRILLAIEDVTERTDMGKADL